MRTQQIRNRLHQRRRDLLARYHDELARAAEEVDSGEVEGIGHATELWDVRVLSVLSDTDAAALGKITAALRRLDECRYGLGTECGVALEPARLAVLPEVPTCFDCALDAEQPDRSRLAV